MYNVDNALKVMPIMINPLGPRILLKHAPLFPGFLANFERFYLLVFKTL